MSNPVVANRAPAPGSVAGILDYVRFSLRNQDSQVLRDSLNSYVGYGPAFYTGQVLPESLEFPRIALRSLSGNPVPEVTRSMEGDVLRIDSGPTGIARKGLYYLGGLQAPATPGQPVIVEFTLELDSTEMVPDGSDFTGVVIGLLHGDSGFMLRFFTDLLGTQWIEMFDANQASTQRPLFPATTYKASFDWHGTYNYKVLWDPIQDRVSLYVSSGQLTSATDQLLLSGSVSDFPAVIPGSEETNQPWLYFGHGFADPVSTSRWHSVYLFNLVTAPHVGGVVRGEHDGFYVSNNIVEYFGSQPIFSSNFAWTPVPESFDSGTGETLTVGDVTEIRKTSGSFGFIREEPRSKMSVSIVDFSMAADVIQSDAASESSGVEVFLDGGVGSFEARVGFLQNAAGTRSVGFLQLGGNPSLITGYISTLRSWGQTIRYRLIVDPLVGATLYELLDTGDIVEAQLITIPIGSMPVSTKLIPGFGIMHNGLASTASSLIRLFHVRHMTNVERMEPIVLPTAQGWTQVGAGSAIESVGVLFSSNATGEVLYEKVEPALDGDNGLSIEFRMRVVSYQAAGLLDPAPAVTGAGVAIDDGARKLVLAFADDGSIGKIVFLTSDADLEENLRSIRSGDESLDSTYTEVDWTQMHTYRIDRTIGGQVSVSIDDATPSISISELVAPYVPGGGVSKVQFGNFLNHHSVHSEWAYVRHSVSDGLDVKTRPVLDEDIALARFDHAVSVIVEAEDV